MKTKYISYIFAFLFSLFGEVTICFSQATSVDATLIPPAPNEPYSTSPVDFLGWDGTVTIPLDIRHDGPYSIDFYTNATFRMIIDPTGFVGIGTSTPFTLLHVYSPDKDALGTFMVDLPSGGFGTSDMEVGVDSTGNGTIRQWYNYPILFYTNGIESMRILEDQKIAVNTTTVATNSQFEVNNDINLKTSVLDHGYRIGDILVLSKPGNSNIFVGENAGGTIAAGTQNTHLGFNAGTSNTGAGGTTFIGADAGHSNTTGDFNTFAGWKAGYKSTVHKGGTFVGVTAGYRFTDGFGNSCFGFNAGGVASTGTGSTATGDNNTLIGAQAGRNITTGFANTMVGLGAGEDITIGSRNVFLGNMSGMMNDSASYNTFAGDSSGSSNRTGSNNIAIGKNAGDGLNMGTNSIFIGINSDQSVSGLNNASAIGSNAIVTATDKMILGDNNVNVGIGLSNVAVGPVRKLEINSTNPQLRLSNNYSVTYTDLQTTSLGDLFIHPDSGSTDRKVGINISTPGNTLEINSNSGSVTNSASGLKFTDMNNTVTPMTNPTQSVLSVDNQGNVILVKDSSTSGSGGNVSTCATTTTNYLSKYCSTSTTIGNTQVYDDGTNVLIGYGSSVPSADHILEVKGSIMISKNDPLFPSSPGTSVNGYYIDADRVLAVSGNYSSNICVGVAAGNLTDFSGTSGENTFLGWGSGDSLVYGFYNTFVGELSGFRTNGTIGSAVTGNLNTMVGASAGVNNTTGYSNIFLGESSGSANIDGYENIYLGDNAGTSSTSEHNNICIGNSSGITAGNNNAIAIGTVSHCSNCMVLGQNPVGIGTTSPSYPLEVSGSISGLTALFSGYISANGTTLPSDAMLKNNIANIPNSSNIIRGLTPRQYQYNTVTYPQMNLPLGNQFGLVAQELEQVLPELIGNAHSPAVYDTLGNLVTASFQYKTINYTGLIPILLGGIKEQQQTIDSLLARDSVLETRLNNLEQVVNNCCSPGTRSNGNQHSISIELGSANTIILNQNDPNPFAEQTTVTYSIPEDVNKAEIIFFDNNGKVLKTVIINERGPGQIIVYASNLSNGIYSYSLIADGKMVDTKKMVKQN